MSTSDPRPPSERDSQRDELLEVLNSLRSTVQALAEATARSHPAQAIVWNDEIEDLSQYVYSGVYTQFALPGPTGGCYLRVTIMTDCLELTLDNGVGGRVWQRRLYWRR